MAQYHKLTPIVADDSGPYKMQLNRDKSRSNMVLTIVGGVEAEINNYPYTAQYGPVCAAAIIGEKWALTAAHCRKHDTLQFGSKFLNHGRKVKVKNVYNHPGWSTGKKSHRVDYDYRLVELNETLKFDFSNIQPIKIARPSDMVVGKELTVTGWGDTLEGGHASPVLRAVTVPLVSKNLCQRINVDLYRGTLTPRMFCAGFKEGKKDACQGDSGGPAAADGRLYGAVSFGYGCATPGYYGVYSNVAEVRDWIQNVTGLNLD